MAESADTTGEARRSGGRWTLWTPTKNPDPQGSGAENRETARYLWSGIRRLLGFGFMRVYKPLRKISSTEPVCARARWNRLGSEHISTSRNSQNADRHMEKLPVGQIELVLPYDGDQYFSRQARKTSTTLAVSGPICLPKFSLAICS